MIKLQQQNQSENPIRCMLDSPHHDSCSQYQPTALSQSFYDHVSLIIKLFRKQLTLFIKLTQTFIQDTQLLQQINHKKQEAVHALKSYETTVLDQPLYAVVQRFIARIREILQLTNNIAPGFLQYVSNGVKKIQIYVHKNIGTITIFQIFHDILNILPSYFQTKSFSPQKAKQKAKQNKQNIPHQKRSTALDQILENFKKSFSLLSTLDIDEAEYRALFFSARQDRHRETGYLENEMKYRNRFIREEMQKYDAGYESYRQKLKREKQNYNKKQMSRMKRMMSLNEKLSPKKIENQENSDHNVSLTLKEIKEEKKSYSPDFLFMQSKVQKSSNLLTTYNFNDGAIKHTTTHSNMYSKNPNKQRLNKINHRVTNQKAREEEFQDFINEIKVKGEFRMTKVLFGRDGKLQLSPYTDVKPGGALSENPTAAAIKNKIIFRKAQENIRKKLNRFTTEPPALNTTLINSKPAVMESSPPEKKLHHVPSDQTESLKNAINRKMRKFTWKDKEIKFMGVKGVSSVNGHK